MQFSPEEQSSYVFSLSNLATIKVFHDAGVNIHSFSDYMVDVNYSMVNGEEIFKEGCLALFPSLKTYSLYETEDEMYLNKLKEEKSLPWVPEYLYQFTNEPLEQLFESPTYAQQMEMCIYRSNKLVQNSFYDGEIVPFNFGGFGVALYSQDEYHEVAQAVVYIYNEANRLFQELKGEKK